MEFVQHFKKIKAAVDRAIKKDPHLFQRIPHYQIDHASWHKLTAAELGLRKCQLLFTPVLGPEFQRIVEHQLSGRKRAYQEAFNDDETLEEGSEAAVALLESIMQKIDPKKVNKDVQGLPAMYANIIAKKGDYAGSPYR